MEKILLDLGWQMKESNFVARLLLNSLKNWKEVNLPHDMGVELERKEDAAGGRSEGFTQAAGLYYRKELFVENCAQSKRFWLEFEGVAGLTQVWVNGEYVGKHLNPFTGFWMDITDLIKIGEHNEILVYTDNRKKPNCRWYMGTGIYGHVWLHVGDEISIRPRTLRAATLSLDGQQAVVRLSAVLDNSSGRAEPVSVRYCVKNRDGRQIAVRTEQFVMEEGLREVQMLLELDGITAWSIEHPYLYLAEITVTTEDEQSDADRCKMGIRTVCADSNYGLQINQIPVKLKGGCIHHDLGLLGVASFDAAIYRKVKILKENGYNALRLAHNPYVPAYFDACDELGIMVIEEAFDEWVLGRSSFGCYETFEYEWEKVLEAMIGRDYNHPSIIMWSTGNDVEEREGVADGFAWSRRLADKVRELDGTRPVTVTACSLTVEYTERPHDILGRPLDKQSMYMAFDNFESGVDFWGDMTAPFFEPVDVAGYNYKTVRYGFDAVKFPGRVIMGTETYPRSAFDNWRVTMENKNVIGDFVWTAMDHLGEAGLGQYTVSVNPGHVEAVWPWLTAGCGDLDLLGDKRPQGCYRDAVWQKNYAPSLFVLPPDLTGRTISRLSWTWDPVTADYTWPGAEGRAMEAHVYAAADEVELIQNGRSLGRHKTGKEQEYRTVFSIVYEPGTLEAVAFCGGRETGRDVLATNSAVSALLVTPDREQITGDGMDLCFVSIQALDGQGREMRGGEDRICVTLEGAGELLAVGTACPRTERKRPFKEQVFPLYQGRAMAVIRSPQGPGRGTLTVSTVNYSDTDGEVSAQTVIEYLPDTQNAFPWVII